MPTVSTLNVSDGIITGQIDTRVLKCEACGRRARGIVISSIELPDGISPLLSFVFYKKAPPIVDELVNPIIPIKRVGISCGCYAKGHRQIAHIDVKRKNKRRK